MDELNEIERLADRNERIRQYHAVVAAEARHHRAWNNLAVDLLGAGRWIEARRAALTVRAIDPALATASGPCKELLAVGGYALESELVATPSHVVYRATGNDGPVLIRALLDCDARAAARLYGEHEVVTRHEVIDGVARALSSVRAADGTLFQVLGDAPGRALHERIVGGVLPSSDGLAVVDRVAEVVTRARAAGIQSIELRPEYILVGDGAVVTLLGPLSWRGDEAWRAPEERGGAAPGPAGDVYRLGLLVAVVVTGQAPPTMGADGQRKLPRLPPGEVRAAELLTRSLAVDPAARPSLETWRAALSAARGEAPRTDAALRRLGDLALVRELGRGRLATVYEAVTASGERCAVKVLHPAAAADADMRSRFRAEARAVSDVDHPGVIKVLAHGQDLDEHYVVMELAEGGSLADRLSASGPMSADDATDLGRQVASAMHAVHTPSVDGGRHLVHRDLKPGNILYRRAGEPEVAVGDFGVAKLYGEPTEHGVALTSTGRPLGTPAYMAPEQWMMLDDIDARADVYALGAVLYESLTGRPPFTGRNDYELQQAHLTGEPPSLAEAGVPPRLAAVVHKMLARDRTQRFATMAEVEDALAAWPALAKADAKAADAAAAKAAAEAARRDAAARDDAAKEAAAKEAAARAAAAKEAAAKEAAAKEAAERETSRGRRRAMLILGGIVLAGAGLVIAFVLMDGDGRGRGALSIDAPDIVRPGIDAPDVDAPDLDAPAIDAQDIDALVCPGGAGCPAQADGAPCLVATDCASGVCEGLGCGPDAPGVCAPRMRSCLRDLRIYCGCNGLTFRGSSDCPGRRYARLGTCLRDFRDIRPREPIRPP